MPLSSAEIAAATGAFVQQSAMNLQYSQMIGAGGMQAAMTDSLAGGIMSRGAGIGSAVGMGALGLAGLDPLSLGLRAGMGAFGRGAGVMGAGMAGLGMAGAASLGIAAIGAVGNQVMMGAQQQSQLNSTLRQNFNFMTPHGQGFDRSGMQMIGNNMRQMTHEFGPAGQVVSMNELTQLAGNMGRMGMSSGVRDAQEFSRKFREMVSTLKTVAQELGTSLQEAQQFMSAQKSSGIFRMTDQAKFATQARGTAMAGGLALSEVTAMSNIGSQISRSVGGLGRAGAFGGMKTIGQIGTATQMGVLSEEDIYNATGLTGAEGRQAMATNMMSQSANFMRSGRGRYFLASIAGKNGQLDEGSVANWMAGGMDVGDTRAAAGRNLAGVGRANFIRNEGRLRGAALEQFGGMAQTMAYSQWLQGRGHDPSNMDDRSMLAFQRFSGLGRDEADNAIKMVQRLPEIMQEQRNRMADDRYNQDIQLHKQTTGVAGAKRKLEQFREGVQSKMQQFGQDLYNSMTDTVESMFNKAMGITERRVTENVNELWRSAKMGGAGGQQIMDRLMGKGLSGFAASSNFRLQGGVGAQEWMTNQKMQMAAEMGTLGQNKELAQFANAGRGWIRDAYTTSLAGLKGQERIDAFGKMLSDRAFAGDASAKQLLGQWREAGSIGQAGMLANIEAGAGVVQGAGLAANMNNKKLGMMGGQFSTLREGDLLLGRQMLGRSMDDTSGQRAWRAAGKGATRGALSFATFGLSSGYDLINDIRGKESLYDTFGGDSARNLAGRINGSDTQEVAAGAFMRTAAGEDLMFGAITGGDKGLESLQDQIMQMNAKGNLSDADKGQLALMQRGVMANRFAALKEGKITADQYRASTGTAPKEGQMKDMGSIFAGQAAYNAIGGALYQQQVEKQNEILRREVAGFQDSAKQGVRSGLMSMGSDGKITLSARTRDEMSKAGVGFNASTIDSIMNMQQSLTGDYDKDQATLQQLQQTQGTLFEDISKMSIAQKKKMARSLAGSEFGDMAAASIGRERRMASAVRSRRGDAVGGISAMLGMDLDKETLAGMKGKSDSEVAAILAGKLGVKDETFEKQLSESIKAGRGKKTGESADLLARAVEQSDQAKKKIEASQRDKDPQAQMVEAIKTGNRYLEALVKSNDAAKQALAQIAGNTAGNGNPEGDKK